MPQKCPGGLWDHPRPILDHSGPIMTKKRLQTNRYNISDTISYTKSYNKSYKKHIIFHMGIIRETSKVE